MATKRKRDPTFSYDEKETLLGLVQAYYHTVEAKQTDGATIKSKLEGWQNIATEYNSIHGSCPREPVVLRNCWENLKKRAKQESALGRMFEEPDESLSTHKKLSEKIYAKVLDIIQNTSGATNFNTANDDSDNDNTASTSKLSRRMVHNQAKTPSSAERLKFLRKSDADLADEHEIKMKILRLHLQKEEESLRQAILKTRQEEVRLEMLEIELKNLKGNISSI